MSEKMSPVAILREYFNPPVLRMDELKELPQKDRYELAALAAKEMGVEVAWPPGVEAPKV